jgi:folylpolyglutamate synthase/dihydrofolate synthase
MRRCVGLVLSPIPLLDWIGCARYRILRERVCQRMLESIARRGFNWYVLQCPFGCPPFAGQHSGLAPETLSRCFLFLFFHCKQSRMERVLRALDSPQRSLRCVHVAGTKGKGSTSAFLGSILKASGYRVGMYSSPHISSICERIRIDGENISEADLDSLLVSARDRIEEGHGGESLAAEQRPSHFEVLTGVALRHFRDSRVDLAIIETGLGGERDATNVLNPECLDLAVITPIGFEHGDALGGSVESIARAKAGILKKGRAAVVSNQPIPEAKAVLLHEASERKVPTLRTEAVVKYHLQEGQPAISGIFPGRAEALRNTVSFQVPRNISSACFECEEAEDWEFDASLMLVGEHQASNAATAIASAMAMRSESGYERISKSKILEGLQATSLPGRLELVDATEVEGRPILTLVDGAHTRDSARHLGETVRQLFPGSKIALVVSMASDKDHESFFLEIQKAKPSVIIFTETTIAGGTARSASPGTLVGAWQVAKMKNNIAGWRCRELIQASIQSSLAKALHELSGEACSAAEPGIILVAGSLHACNLASQR